MAGRGLDRRDFLKRAGAGFLTASLGWRGLAEAGEPADPVARPFVRRRGGLVWTPQSSFSKVSLVRGNERREITFKAVKAIEEDIIASIGTRKKILIKPNFVSTGRQLAATHVDAVRAILDVIRPRCPNLEIIVGESTASNDGTMTGYKNFGYLDLEKEFKVTLVDLNTQAWQYRYVFGQDNEPRPLRIISTFLDPDVYVISAAKLKTHDRVLTTLSLKNVLVGAPLNDYRKNDKSITHPQSMAPFSKNTVLHFNLFHLAQEIYPDLSVIDGFEGMEGNGPVGGTPYDSRIAVASLDPLAADTVATRVMGFDPEQILYLRAMSKAGMGQGDLGKMEILGDSIETCQCKFQPSKLLIEPYGLA